MAAPTVRGVGAFGSGTTSFTAAVPTGGSAPQAGDAMYIVMESTDSTTTAGTPNTPSGWTKLFENTIAAGSSTEPAVSTLTIFGKIAGAGEGNVTVDGVGNHCAGAMVVVAGHGLGAITDTVVGTAADHGTSTTNILAPSITVEADSLIITCMGLGDDANDTTNVSGVTNANLASITERIDQTVSTGSGGGVGIYTATCAGTSTGTTEWDHDTAAASQSVQLGIKPAGSQSADGAAPSASWVAVAAVALATFAAAGSAASAAWSAPNAAAAATVEVAATPASSAWSAPNASTQTTVSSDATAASAAWSVPDAVAEFPPQGTSGSPPSSTWVDATAQAEASASASGIAVSAAWSSPNGAAAASASASGLAPSSAWSSPNGGAAASHASDATSASASWSVPNAAAVDSDADQTAGLAASAAWSVSSAAAELGPPPSEEQPTVGGFFAPGVSIDKVMKAFLKQRTSAGPASAGWGVVSAAATEEGYSDDEALILALAARR